MGYVPPHIYVQTHNPKYKVDYERYMKQEFQEIIIIGGFLFALLIAGGIFAILSLGG